MAQVNYDYFGGYLRVAKAVEHLDARVTQIILLHAALEHEIDIVLSQLLPRSDKLADFKFLNKVNVLNAAWQADPAAADRVCEVLQRFNALRNSMAHQNTQKIDGQLQALINAYRAIDPTASQDTELGAVAQGICAYLGDGPMPEQMANILKGLASAVDKLPKAKK